MKTYHESRPAEIQKELPRVTYNFAIKELGENDPKRAEGYRYSAHSINVPAATPASAALVILIADYDNSSAVNSFLLNGQETWLDKNTRVGLMNSIQVEINAGHETTTLWLGIVPFTLPCELAMQLISNIELYAIECYRITAQHQSEVAQLGQTLVEAQDEYAELLQARDRAIEQEIPGSGPTDQELATARAAQAKALADVLEFDFTAGYPERISIDI